MQWHDDTPLSRIQRLPRFEGKGAWRPADLLF